jgi:hypothetical protein
VSDDIYTNVIISGIMSKWTELVDWMYGDAQKDEGFWYSHSLWEVDGLSEEQLYWTPDLKGLCILWHVGHIAHRERTHIGGFLQEIDLDKLIPPQYEVFGPDWHSTEEVRKSIESVERVFDWVQGVREESRKYIGSLSEEDFHRTTNKSMGKTVAHWLFITTAHTSLHIGRIQLLRSLIENEYDRAC